LRAAAKCLRLTWFVFGVPNNVLKVDDISMFYTGVDAIAKMLAKMVVAPTEPGKQMGWHG
jgi:hypothetical protein